jgi:hypothetical protein
MKNMKTFVGLIIAGAAILSAINLSNAQYGQVSVNLQAGNYGGGNYGGGYYGGGNYGQYNNNGYAVAPYYGTVTGPIGNMGCHPNNGWHGGDGDDYRRDGGGYNGGGYRGGGYGGGGYGGNGRCAWDNYWHQWRCW